MKGQAGSFRPGQGRVEMSQEGLGAWEPRMGCLEVGGSGLDPRTKLLKFPKLQWFLAGSLWEDSMELRANEGEPALLGLL